MGEKVSAALLAFLEAPTADNFQSLQQAVAASAAYAPYSKENSPNHAFRLLNEGKFAEAEAHLRKSFWNYLTNPGMHFLLCIALDKQGNKQKASTEFIMSKHCFEAFFAGADGTREKPYRVLHVEDEYDIVGKLGKQMQKQSLIKADGRQFDLFDCADGSAVWFDVSIPYGRMSRQGGEAFSKL